MLLGGNNVVDSLRDWIEKVEKLGELKKGEGVHWDLEIGALSDIVQKGVEKPALLFDSVPGYPKGYRVLANPFSTLKRIAVTLNWPLEWKEEEMIAEWRRTFSNMDLIPHETVDSGPVMENVLIGDDINLLSFPTPKWNEKDGGRYIGTGCAVALKDPDSGWVNVGTYRVMVQDEKTASIFIVPGKQGDRIRKKYWDKGENCPVAVSVGHHPIFLMVGGLEIGDDVCEYDFAGQLLGESIKTVNDPIYGLPVPADSEIVIVGEIPPDKRLEEGPFGEWMGYYAGGRRKEAVIDIKAIMHRDDPIILGAIPRIPPSDITFYRQAIRSGMVWDQLEKAGVPGVKGVWAHEAGGSRLMLIVSIEQQFPGHSKQAGLIASQCRTATYNNRCVVVVDDDIDIFDTNEVLWAILTRAEPSEDIEILKKGWSSKVDPLSYPKGKHFYNSRMVIDACRSWERLEDFPEVVAPNPELRKNVLEKWGKTFGIN
ncbi:hypothetical protein BTR23_25230 [Alkalihalophilus pseudofirmus]|nr:hypothetical protein BTR23_25230 [Alkalihalophilus pseudofirmus]